MPKVSIIVPIYGVERYIDRCSRSLFEQTLDDIEYIFVDDCTPDRSIEVLKEVLQEYPHRKEQCKIISHSSNQGLPSARKTGVLHTSGDYILHCDSDDWMDITMCEKMWQKAIDNSADMVMCGYNISSSNQILKAIPIKNESDPFRALIADQVAGYAWNKLVKREIYSNDIVWPADNLLEDTCLMIQLAYYCKKITFISEPLYFYFQNDTGICASFLSEKKFMGAKSNLESTISFLIDKGLYDRYSKEINYLKVRITRLSTLLSDELFRKYNKHIDWNLLLSKYCSAKEKLGYLTKLLGIHGISRIFKK